MCVPIAIFAFNRPEHLRRTLDALAANDLAAESDITIFCDGPRTDEERLRTEAVRTIARAASGFHSVTVVEREKNYGLATSIITGVTGILEKHERIIVLEDDLVTSPFFLQYMNRGLDVYAANPKVASIHGWCFPHAVTDPPQTFFLRGADCWGWATWKRAWSFFEPDAGKLLMQLYKRDLAAAFDLDGAYNYTGMLRDTIEKRVSSWAVRWHASAFLADMYTLYPEHSLVQNIGFDSSGTHCSKNTSYSAPVAKKTVEIVPQQVIESLVMRQAQMIFYKHGNGAANSFRAKGKSLLKDFLPPVLLRCIQKFRHRSHTEQTVTWQDDYPDWATAVAASSGYDREAIYVKVRDAARAVRDGKALWERDSVLFYHEEYNLPLLSALMSIAAWNKGRLRVLDFGGAFGSTYWQHKPLLQNLDTLSWNVVEQPHVVACGREEFSSDGLQFWPDMQSCAANGSVDVVLFSSVLQYLESPYTLLEQAAALNPQAIVLDRTPFAEKGERITVQNVSPEIYPASYACRWLDEAKVRGILRKTLLLSPKWQSQVDPPGFWGVMGYRQQLAQNCKD